MKKKLVYDFNVHRLYYEDVYHIIIEKELLLTITDTIELFFDYDSGRFIYIGGFLPLVKAKRKNIKLADAIDGQYFIDINSIPSQQGVGYDYFEFFKNSERYFIADNLPIINYDEINKKILIGTKNKCDRSIKIDKNIICGFDEDNNLKYFILTLDEVIPCQYAQ